MYADAPYSHDPYSVAAPANAGVLAVSQVVTASLGTVTERFTYRMTGQVITSQLGNGTVKFTYRVLGQQINSAEGMVSVRATYRMTGQVMTMTQGTQTVLFGAVIYPSGNVMNGLLATSAVETRYFVNGIEMQALQGNELIWSFVDDSAPTIWVPVIVR